MNRKLESVSAIITELAIVFSNRKENINRAEKFLIDLYIIEEVISCTEWVREVEAKSAASVG